MIFSPKVSVVPSLTRILKCCRNVCTPLVDFFPFEVLCFAPPASTPPFTAMPLPVGQTQERPGRNSLSACPVPTHKLIVPALGGNVPSCPGAPLYLPLGFIPTASGTAPTVAYSPSSADSCSSRLFPVPFRCSSLFMLSCKGPSFDPGPSPSRPSQCALPVSISLHVHCAITSCLSPASSLTCLCLGLQ